MGCRVWVATEWIIQCADILFQAMNSKEELDKNTARALSTGSLCEGKAPLSVERWEFWKKRFSELATDAGGLSLSEDIKTRISDALKSMDAAKA